MVCPVLVCSRRKAQPKQEGESDEQYRARAEKLAREMAGKAVFAEYRRLVPDHRRDLIATWFDKARDAQQSSDLFGAFIFAWMSFNGWAACVTGEDSDAEQVRFLSLNRELNQAFDIFKERERRSGANRVDAFYARWPIQSVKELRGRGYYWPELSSTDDERDTLNVELLGEDKIRGFAPACFKDHERKGEKVPGDWLHTLPALYAVRCNLFHGDKSASLASDRSIVRTAGQVLIGFLDSIGFPCCESCCESEGESVQR